MTVETLSAYFIICILLALSPGPDNIFVLTQSVLYGKKSGILVILGLCTGLIFHTAAVALGVAIIFQTSAWAFNALKMLGVVYLLYLAWEAFRAKSAPITAEPDSRRGMKLYGRGIFMNITNPKVSIFFLAFLPQFANPASGSLTLQIFLLGFLFMIATILVFGIIALMAGTLGEWLNRSVRIQYWLNRTAGIVFVGLAVKLITLDRS